MDNKIIPFPEVGGEFDPVQKGVVRRVWRSDGWRYNIVDFIMWATEYRPSEAASYWRRLRSRLSKQGNETVSKLDGLKMASTDGKFRRTDGANEEVLLRLAQEIPGTRTDVVKDWLAKVGAERLEEMRNPELGISRASERAAQGYEKRGKSAQWIDARLIGIEARNRFTAALMDVILTMPSNLYLSATEQLYKGLWDRTTAQLRRDLNMPKSGGGNVRDRFGRYALIYTSLVENLVADKLGLASEITDAMAMEIIWEVAKMIQGQARQTAQALGVDLVTERPLFQVLDNPRLPGA